MHFEQRLIELPTRPSPNGVLISRRKAKDLVIEADALIAELLEVLQAFDNIANNAPSTMAFANQAIHMLPQIRATLKRYNT